MEATQLVVSCEHASNRIPSRYANLGLRPRVLDSHIAWDRGAEHIARSIARRFACPCFRGRYSRLLVDLNRNSRHPLLIPGVIHGVRIPGNVEVTPGERAERVRLFHQPYREAVLSAVRAIIKAHASCLHLSVHSFTPRLRGIERGADVGLLYDPRKRNERRLASLISQELKRHHLRVRMNFPYRGTSDGITKHCRNFFSPRQYLGLEIELNQRRLTTEKGVSHMGRAVERSLCAALPLF